MWDFRSGNMESQSLLGGHPDAMVTKSTLNRLMKFRLLACYGCSFAQILFGSKA